MKPDYNFKFASKFQDKLAQVCVCVRARAPCPRNHNCEFFSLEKANRCAQGLDLESLNPVPRNKQHTACTLPTRQDTHQTPSQTDMDADREHILRSTFHSELSTYRILQ